MAPRVKRASTPSLADLFHHEFQTRRRRTITRWPGADLVEQAVQFGQRDGRRAGFQGRFRLALGIPQQDPGPDLQFRSFMVPVRGREEGRSSKSRTGKSTFAATARMSRAFSRCGRCR